MFCAAYNLIYLGVFIHSTINYHLTDCHAVAILFRHPSRPFWTAAFWNVSSNLNEIGALFIYYFFYSCLNSSAFSFSLFSLDVIQFLRHICEYSFGILSISSYHSRDLNLNVFFTTFHLINNNFFLYIWGGD